MDKQELDKILEDHKLWLEDKNKGEQADLSGAYLRGAYLRGANLSDADLSGANFSDANISDANFSVANIYGAKGIYSFGPVGEEGRIGYAVKHEDCIMVQLGCFWDTSDKAIDAVANKYGKNSPYGKQIKLAVEVLEGE